jgi:hypothetical protein
MSVFAAQAELLEGWTTVLVAADRFAVEGRSAPAGGSQPQRSAGSVAAVLKR